ncbi:uncharacterized protein LOC122956288 [Acropora millepora]|uniref:uncharacterized protein LOC122956288 n=1 Tax=Acropora millepora TaxID=45264 RepID=UPI001CF1F053|nr:uncharacterized protein LOC122956288 [Acropora millepora]
MAVHLCDESSSSSDSSDEDILHESFVDAMFPNHKLEDLNESKAVCKDVQFIIVVRKSISLCFHSVIPGSCNMKIAWVFLILLICAAAKEEDTKSCCENNQEVIKLLRGKMEETLVRICKLEGKVSEMEGTIATLESKVANLTGQVKEIRLPIPPGKINKYNRRIANGFTVQVEEKFRESYGKLNTGQLLGITVIALSGI